MDAVRCLRCGETRWTFLSGTLERLLADPCEACGGKVVGERRRPGADHRAGPDHRALADERRERGPRLPRPPRVAA
jgi:hypothetical protein